MNLLRSPRSVTMAMAVLSMMAAASSAEVIHVPADYPTIQQAINASVHGDEIVVAPGVYNETIRFLGKSIVVRSEKGAAATTIDATGTARSTVSFTQGEDFTTIIDGFTITGGTGTPGMGVYLGGGLLIFGASPSVENCIITGNSATLGGGGYIGPGSQPWFVNCTFSQNVATEYGGGLYNAANEESEPLGLGITAISSTFEGNTATHGGAIRGAADIALIGCSLTNNTASSSVGGISMAAGSLTMQDCLVKGNSKRAIAVGPMADIFFTGTSFSQNPHGAVSAWAIETGRSLTVFDCTFEDNNGLGGAAIAVSGGFQVSISDSVFDTNMSTGSGGAIQTHCYSGLDAYCPSLTIDNSSFLNNRSGKNGGAIGMGCVHGGLSAACASISVYDSAFLRNSALFNGGAIFNDCIEWIDPDSGLSQLTCGDVYVGGSTMEQNAAGEGGAIASLDESVSTIEDTMLCNNVPTHFSGDWKDEGGNEIASVADLNCDGSVGVADLLQLLAEWGECDASHGGCAADLDGDGNIGVSDLLVLLSEMG